MSSSNAHCGARAKSTGKPCRNPAGFRTDHVGEGRCFIHGGKSPVRHGRYSQVKHERLGDLIQKYADDPDPLNLEPELATLRALLEDHIERFDEFKTALVAWYREKGVDPPKGALLSVGDARKLIAEIGRLTERIDRIKNRGNISVPEFYALMGQMGRVVAAAVQDEELRQQIREGWMEIRVDSSRPERYVVSNGRKARLPLAR